MEPEMCFCATAQPQPLVTGRRLLILGLFEEDVKLLVRQGSAELEEPVPPPGRSGRSRMPGQCALAGRRVVAAVVTLRFDLLFWN